jgi:hypothetical protein
MIKMDMWDNALSSLVEGLRCLKRADNGEKEQYKFAVLHISHYFEISLKYAVYDMHPLLIFKKPFAKNLAKEQTITPQEAFYIIKNSSESDSGEEADISDDDMEELVRLKHVRNNIEHFKFELTPEEIKDDISFFLRTMDTILHDICDITFAEYLEKDEIEYYCKLTDQG